MFVEYSEHVLRIIINDDLLKLLIISVYLKMIHRS